KGLSDVLVGHEWGTPAYGKILQLLEVELASGRGFDMQVFVKHLPQELMSAFDRCFLLPVPTFMSDDLYGEEIKKISEELHVLGLRKQIKTISEKIKQTEKTGDEAMVLSLQEQLPPLLKKLSKKEDG
ncbi:MAG: hypothetical protein KGJ07_08520, partial [Patescibacteria group bacterium]|nr:hypothetical protein [Patescibacteria group bacterium]